MLRTSSQPPTRRASRTSRSGRCVRKSSRSWARPASPWSTSAPRRNTAAIMLSQGLARGWREAAIVLGVVIALAVAWSRVYLGVHYPTDVAAGLLLGWSWALLVFHWARPKLIQDQPAMGQVARR